MQKMEGVSTDVTLVASVICWSLLHTLSYPGDEISDNVIAQLAKLLQQLNRR